MIKAEADSFTPMVMCTRDSGSMTRPVFFWANCVMVSKPPKDDHPAFTVRQHDQSRPSRLHVLVPIHPTKALRLSL